MQSSWFGVLERGKKQRASVGILCRSGQVEVRIEGPANERERENGGRANILQESTGLFKGSPSTARELRAQCRGYAEDKVTIWRSNSSLPSLSVRPTAPIVNFTMQVQPSNIEASLAMRQGFVHQEVTVYLLHVIRPLVRVQ